MSKQGKPYEKAVAEVLQAFDPAATVSQGKWVVGPDGRRELDVHIEGQNNGKSISVIIECKDFNPAKTGPVGIGYVDALESKRHDIAADFAMICSNAGFTIDAIRKAKRVGIALAGVMRKGDSRFRFAVSDEIYPRKVRVKDISLSLGGGQIDITGVPFFDVQWESIPVAHWVLHRLPIVIGCNPIVEGHFRADYALTTPLTFVWPGGQAQVSSFSFNFTLTGTWLAQRIEIDASCGLYDWLRHRARLSPGLRQIQYKGIDFEKATPITSPPDKEFIRSQFQPGEMEMKLLMFENMITPAPIPCLDQFIAKQDLDPFVEDLNSIIDVPPTKTGAA
jgi:hypothetical protein